MHAAGVPEQEPAAVNAGTIGMTRRKARTSRVRSGSACCGVDRANRTPAAMRTPRTGRPSTRPR